MNPTMSRSTHVATIVGSAPPVDYAGNTGDTDGPPFGQHLIIDLTGCDRDLISRQNTLALYVDELVELIRMTPYGPCRIDHFGHDSPETAGYTLVQLIETSSITGHFVDHHGTAHLDVFSCREFDSAAALAHAEQFFRATGSRSCVVYR